MSSPISINSVWSANPPGGPDFPVPYRYHWKVRIQGRVDLAETVISDMGMLVKLVGGSIAGDTIIPPPMINWTVGMEEFSRDGVLLYPNPAENTCFISGVHGGELATVFDLEGRMVLTTRLASHRAALDVSGLAPGTYAVNVKGLRPQRFIIAR